MKLVAPLLFLLGYFPGGYAVIWTLVMLLKKGDPKFAEAVGFYYGIWIAAYLPIAIIGTIALFQITGELRKRVVTALLSVAAVLMAMFASLYFDIHWAVLVIEYLIFGFGFWILVKRAAPIVVRS